MQNKGTGGLVGMIRLRSTLLEQKSWDINSVVDKSNSLFNVFNVLEYLKGHTKTNNINVNMIFMYILIGTLRSDGVCLQILLFLLCNCQRFTLSKIKITSRVTSLSV